VTDADAVDAGRGLLGLLLACDALGVEPVRHGDFIGLRGPAISRGPPEVWELLTRHEAALRQRLRAEETPFRARQAAARAPAGGGDENARGRR
jgi:hypothetical protein